MHHHCYQWPWNYVEVLAQVLLIVGGINWGLIGFYGINLVSRLFGRGSNLSRAVYGLVGIAAVYMFYSYLLYSAADICCVYAFDDPQATEEAANGEPET